jgi:hypothetical protein
MEHTQTIAERLRGIANDLKNIADSMSEPVDMPTLPAAAAKRLAEKKCLICDKDSVKRGLCETHYQKIVVRGVKKNPTIEPGLIAAGKLAPLPRKFSPTTIDTILASLASEDIQDQPKKRKDVAKHRPKKSDP